MVSNGTGPGHCTGGTLCSLAIKETTVICEDILYEVKAGVVTISRPEKHNACPGQVSEELIPGGPTTLRDVANVVALLDSEPAADVSGAMVAVDGGFSALSRSF